ncbi:MAG TPA: tRNA pseudouridine(55) synthase TruB, partial [Vicinamibacterales bacterium]|nr:tRNA pseudouridine(55) synthase TruB [Vicinamibacterales bacterium]
MISGLLVIDKPSGPTSHDVVSRIRRALHEKRVGHTGTLDPLATGVLPLVLGRATRLARFLSGSDKTYEAVITLGVATETGDAEGAPIAGAIVGTMPERAAIDRALDAFRGTFLQQPPAHSAKKIGGTRSYELARRALQEPVLPNPVAVCARRIELLRVDAALVAIRLECSAGFYVRALARDLGERLGVGAHLAALRRTWAAGYGLDAAVTLADAEGDPARTVAAVVGMGSMLPQYPAVTLSSDDVRRALNGRDIRGPRSPLVRLLDPVGELVGIAEPAGT